jgi:hypothetical protein
VTVTPKVRREVIARDHHSCRWCGRFVDVESGWYSLQHRRARGMGGTRRVDTDLACNLVLVCGTGTTECHGYIESHREEAVSRGFNVADRHNPALVPLLDHMGRWFRFDALGGVEVIPEIDAIEYMLLVGAHQIRSAG